MPEPITVAEAKQHLRIVDNTGEDTLIGAYIAAARRWVEDYTGHILVEREVVLNFPSWGDYLSVFLRPVTSVDTITYTDADGEEQPYEDFLTSDAQYPLLIRPVAEFPELGTNGSITVTLTAGYEAEAIPEPLIHAIKVLLTAMFQNRGGGWGDAEMAARSLCKAYRPPGMA